MGSKIKNFCNNCSGETNHLVLHEVKETGDPDDYHYIKYYYMVRCLGCENVSYREDFHDYEAAYPTSEEHWEIPTESVCYPYKSISKLKTYVIPELVRTIFNETCRAIASGSGTLAGIGLRATIEAVCNEESIQGRDLGKKINALVTKGVISKKDSARLHSIRFIGNDAAHNVITPKSSSLQVALSIIEHLLQTLYILDSDSKGSLPTLIEDYDEFKLLLSRQLAKLEKGGEYPLRFILGKDVRRISDKVKEFESQLIKEIKNNEYKKVSLGKCAKFADSKEEFQHFII